LINADRKSRAQRSTALTCALMAEVALGGTLLVLSGSQDPATTTVFGRVGSGRVCFRGQDMAGLDPLPLRRQVGMVFQRPTPSRGPYGTIC
jgi:hypothetical protein